MTKAPPSSAGATPQPSATSTWSTRRFLRVPERDQIAPRAGDREHPAAPIEGDAAGVLAHAPLDGGGRVEQPDRAAVVQPDQRHPVAPAALVLHRHGDQTVAVDREMADAQAVEARRQPEGVPQAPARQVEIGEREPHAVEIELGALGVRMRPDAAIGGDQRRAVGHRRDSCGPTP